MCCGHLMRWVDDRDRSLLTRNGWITFTRGYYHCPCCGRGAAPADDACQVPPGRASWPVREGVAMLGAWVPFREVAQVYAHLTGHAISHTSAEDWTETLGAAYVPPTLDRYAPGPVVDTLFLQADGVMVQFLDGWHEVKVVVCWGRKDGEDLPPRYLTAHGVSWEELTEQIAALARQMGVRQAGEVVCMADGALPIWALFRRLFPQARHLLDWFHLQEHLATVARLLPEGAAWHEAQKAALAERGPAETRAALVALATAPPDPADALQQAAQKCLNYLEANADRLDYPTARALGLPIGTGRIESACRHVVQQRCKQPGMRWKPEHLDWVLGARCAYLNNDWALAVKQMIAKAATAAKAA